MQGYDYHPLPAAGDILWCRFPEIVGKPGPKPRPALVVAVAPQHHQIKVAYGTSKKLTRLLPGEFLLDPAMPGFDASGLSVATKFDLANLVALPFNSDWFDEAPGFTVLSPLPKLGVLHPSLMQYAAQAYRQIK